MALPIAVLVSGRGSNLQALIDGQQTGRLPIDIVVVASNRPQAQALQRAAAAGIANFALDTSHYLNRTLYDRAFFTKIAEYDPALIVLAGFMRVLDANVVRQWEGRMINIHPSLLPKYRGLKTHQRVIEAGDRVHGASVHYVIPELDDGPVIAQVELSINAQDTATTIANRLLPYEHQLLCATLELIAQQRIQLAEGCVQYDGKPLSYPLLLGSDGVLRLRDKT